jgi:hypothetical protein
MYWAIYTLSTLPFEVAGLCGSVEECMTLRRSYPNYSSVKLLSQRLAHVVCVLSARLSLELSECKVCQPCEVILEWIKLYKVRRKPWGLSVSPANVFDPPVWCGVERTLCAGDVKTPSLVEKLLSGGGIKVNKGA